MGLVHRGELARLAEEAERATGAGDRRAAIITWRRAMELLPPRSRQHAQVSDRVRDLSRELDPVGGGSPSQSAQPQQTAQAGQGGQAAQTGQAGQPGQAPQAAGSTGVKRAAGAVAMVGLLLWKLKFVLGFVLAQGKLLLVGLTKVSTLTTMLVSLGAYWAMFGYKFALGLILSIYVHEMGHVAALRKYGISAGAPMFIPGFGALVRMKQYPVEPREDARVGLAGPVWGLAAALVAYAVGSIAGYPSWLAIARVGAWINLFNLAPIWQLDGGRGFRALTRKQRIWATAAIGAAWFLTAEGILLLLLIAGVIRVVQKDAPTEPDRRALIEYVVLVAALAALAATKVPGM